MFQNDYIMRMIEMMGSFLRRIKELLDQSEQDHLMDEACREHCGLPLKTLRELSSDTLIQMLPEAPRLLASELLYLTAGYTDNEDDLLKSLRLLASLNKEGPLCEARSERLAEMVEKSLPFLTPRDHMECAAFFMQGNAFASGEDAVFRAVELAEGAEQEAFIAQGIELLQLAALADETDLALCNMSRDELLDSICELKEYQNDKDQKA